MRNDTACKNCEEIFTVSIGDCSIRVVHFA